MNKEVEDKVGEVFFTHSEGLSKKCRFGPLSLCYFILFIYLKFLGGGFTSIFLTKCILRRNDGNIAHETALNSKDDIIFTFRPSIMCFGSVFDKNTPVT